MLFLFSVPDRLILPKVIPVSSIAMGDIQSPATSMIERILPRRPSNTGMEDKSMVPIPLMPISIPMIIQINIGFTKAFSRDFNVDFSPLSELNNRDGTPQT